MESPNTNPAPRAKLHPLVAVAAVSIIALSGVGIAAMVMNHSNATPSPALTVSDRVAPAAALPAIAEPSRAPVPAATPAPAPAKPVHVAPRTPPHVASTTPGYSSSYPTVPSYSSGPNTPSYNNPAPVARAEVCHDCGVVDSVHEIKVKGQGTGVGGVGGAVVGGLLGNQVGAGRGKAAMTVLGAVGGAFAGNAIEKNVRSEVEHQMVVRLDDGTTRTFTQVGAFPYGVGDRVRIMNGRVERG